MKAWLVREKDKFWSTVVFAETRGKARAVALSTDCCEDAKFTDIEVTRMPQADKCYKEGKQEMDWDNPQDRIVLVKDCYFHCSEELFDIEECEICPASEFCDYYQDNRGDASV